MDLTRPMIRTVIPNHGKPWTAADRRFVRRSNLTPVEIAARLGRSVNSVLFVLQDGGHNPPPSLWQSLTDFRNNVRLMVALRFIA